MPKYELRFDPDALKEWNKLDGSIKQELKPILLKRLENPIVENSRLSGDLQNCFKIKSKNTGYRLIYTVERNVLVVTVIANGKRADFAAYRKARKRFSS